ncbi:MAG: hypothetical protein IPJ88_05625 [Myxococcales bacterium]|nr:MAG: hypothetical protein IPJ88_05625 [Myxococcales bacterium]
MDSSTDVVTNDAAINDASTDSSLSPDAGDPVPKTQTIKIATDGDDGEVTETSYYPQGESSSGAAFAHRIFMGTWSGEMYWGYFRFKLQQAISAQANVTSATMKGYSVGTDGVWQSSQDWLVIHLEDSANPSAVQGISDDPYATGGRSLYPGLSVSWNANHQLPWLEAPQQRWETTPDLSVLIQALVDKYGGLALNAYVQLWIRGGNSLSEQAQVGVWDYAQGSATAAELTIEWTE